VIPYTLFCHSRRSLSSWKRRAGIQNGPWRAMLCHGRVTQFNSPRLGQLPSAFRPRPWPRRGLQPTLIPHSRGGKEGIGGNPRPRQEVSSCTSLVIPAEAGIQVYAVQTSTHPPCFHERCLKTHIQPPWPPIPRLEVSSCISEKDFLALWRERMKARVQVAHLVSHSDREIWPFGTFEVEPALIRLTGAVGVRRRAIVFDGWTTY
jgi:hypothetical protein